MKNILYMAALTAALVGASSQVQAQSKLVGYWDFDNLAADGVSIANKVNGELGTVSGSAILTDAGGGRPGAGGNKGFDVGKANPGWLQYDTGDTLNAAAEGDKMSVVLWQKNYSNIDSSSFWGHSDSAGGSRGFQFHIPWSNGTIYFDTQGCCGGDTRLNKAGDGYDSWHHYAFIKDGGTKRIYIDGELFAEQSGYSALTPDYSRYSIGAADNASPPDAVIDDFAVFNGALSQDEIKILAGGKRPDEAFLKDTDGDGLPDGWETQFGLNPNSNADKNTDPDNDGCDNTCEYVAGTNPTDTTPPTLTGALASSTFTTVTVSFSEKVDPTTGGNTANYVFSPALAVTAATVSPGKVTLTTAKQTPGQVYTLTVNNVTDQSKNKLAADSKATVYAYILLSDGVLKFSAWSNIPGNATQGLYDDPRYPAEPEVVAAATALDSRTVYADDSHETYGATIEGVLTAPETGEFDFFLRSDDGGDLWISPDDKAENAGIVAFESGCCDGFKEPGTGDETTASPISLVKGKKYFVRLVYKEGGGGDYGQVAMRKVGDTTPSSALQPLASTAFSVVGGVPANPQGAFQTISPGINANNVLPNSKITIKHFDGKTPLTAANTSLKFNGATVPAVITKEGNVLTVSYDPNTLLASGSVNTVSFSYPDAGGNATSLDYSFTVLTYAGPTKDKVGSYPGLITGAAKYTADAGGKSGKAGDYGLDHTAKGGAVMVLNATWANAATANDEITVAFWQKKYDIAASSSFWFLSPSSNNGERGYQAHAPWDNGHIYFDSAGCCDAGQRIEDDIANFSGYSGEPVWWQDWHHYAFVKKGEVKQIWVDGVLFLEGAGNPLPTDIRALNIGSDNAGGGLNHAIIDDFAVFSKQLTDTQLQSLAGGTLPSALPAATGLIAYWDFNDASTGPVTPPTLSIGAVVNGKITITFQGSLQSADTVGGSYTPVVGTSPLTVDVNAAAKFYRAVK